MSALLHDGRPVPYIGAWSLERVELPPLLRTPNGLALKGQRREADGVTWLPWLEKPGDGEPLEAVHGPRQRRAMRQLLCHACGRPVVRNAIGYPWLVESAVNEPGWPEREVTTRPPTCPSCQPGALSPTRRMVSVRVGRLLTDGVYGQPYTLSLKPAAKKSALFAGDRRLRWMVGERIAATLLDVTLVDMRTQAPLRAGVRR